MQVQTNGSYPFSNSFVPALSEKESLTVSTQLEELQNDFSMISQDLNPTERRLYNTLINAENYQAAKGIVTIGFMRAAGIYEDRAGNQLNGESLSQDLTKLNPPASQKEQNALIALQDYLSFNPSSLDMDKEKRGNLLDLKV